MINQSYVIGLAGRAGAGKDPAAQILAARLPGPSRSTHFAIGLKRMLAGLYGIQLDSPQGHRLFYTQAGKASHSPRPLKPGNSVRDDLKDLGDATRANNPQVWVECVEQEIEFMEGPVAFVTDVRYLNEAAICDHIFWIGSQEAGIKEWKEHQVHSSETLTPDQLPADKVTVVDTGSLLGDLDAMKEIPLLEAIRKRYPRADCTAAQRLHSAFLQYCPEVLLGENIDGKLDNLVKMEFFKMQYPNQLEVVVSRNECRVKFEGGCSGHTTYSSFVEAMEHALKLFHDHRFAEGDIDAD